MSKIKNLREQECEAEICQRTKQEEWDHFYVGLARYMSTKSKDPSTKVGSVIVRPNKSVASVGFNGFPRGADDSLHLYADREYKLSRILHAEQNAITFAREPLDGYTIYVYPFICCDRCFAVIQQEGIKRIVAPVPTTAQLERWGGAFEIVRSLAAKEGIELEEVEYDTGFA
jgi:dCMP deaminase